MSHESSNSHVPTHSGAAASSSTTTTRVGSCAASRARVKARATSSGEFRRRVRALKLVSIARADARRAIRLRTSMASADDAAATWERIVRLASAPDVCDLGQGWPDFGGERRGDDGGGESDDGRRRARESVRARPRTKGVDRGVDAILRAHWVLCRIGGIDRGDV